ncbi:MAG: TIGR03364 family FAD-dependent oxidoreductase [Pseudolabrys sp.]
MSDLAARHYDLVVVGAGICGLAHALTAARRGQRVVVIDRDAQANGASVRNFGFVTVTGQQRGQCWSRAIRSRDVWAEVAPQAGIPVLHQGLVVAVRRDESRAVLEAFMATEMGAGCELIAPTPARERFPMLARARELAAVLYSSHELRVESKDAIAQLSAWLAEAHGVTFLYETAMHDVAPPKIVTSRGTVHADAAVVCPGDDFQSLFPDQLAAYGLTRFKLHMMRTAPLPNFPLNAAIMSDLGLARYLGYAELPEAAALKQRLEAEQPAQLENGVHLIAVQSADGSLIVGDSHHYAATPDPFAPQTVDDLILDELEHAVGARPVVRERWIGTYASAPNRLALIDAPSDAVRVVVITSGTGASTSFAIGEEVIGGLFG